MMEPGNYWGFLWSRECRVKVAIPITSQKIVMDYKLYGLKPLKTLSLQRLTGTRRHYVNIWERRLFSA